MPDNRLHELLRQTLNAEQVLPPQNDALAELGSAVAELGEILAEAHHQAVALSLKSARELGTLRDRFTQIQTNFLSHVRQRAICGNRLVLGFCGGFSAGKSTFLNLLINRKEDYPLPTKATRDTALPVFLLSSGKEERVWVENHQGRGFLEGTLQDLLLFRHSEETSFEPWSYLVRSLYVLAPWIEYSEVAYLDLPGHTAGPEDLRLSLSAARQCDAIVYLIDVAQGDVKETDVKFLRELSGLHPSPCLVLLTKCDKKPPGQLAQVQAKIASSLKEHEIPHEGPYPWTKDPAYAGQHQLGIKTVREYGARLAKTNRDQRFNELATIAARLAAVCADNLQQLKQRQAEHLDRVKEVTATPLADSVFKKAKAITEASRLVTSFVSGTLFPTFNVGEFRQYHRSQSNEWFTASQKGFTGHLNLLTIWGLYATIIAATDDSAVWAQINHSSPTSSSDQWYYEHLKRLRDSYAGVTVGLEEVSKNYTQASQRSIKVVRSVSERAEAVKKRLSDAYWSVKKTAAMG
jgi:GTP-binding protein EngB required for normal cell division